MQNILIIINDAPYGTEKAYNALRLAMTLQKEYEEKININIFLLADAVTCGLPNQKTPNGYYNIERMLKIVIRRGAKIKSCGGLFFRHDLVFIATTTSRFPNLLGAIIK